MASFTSYTGNGSTRNYPAPSYLDREHIVVTLDGVETTDYEWLDSATIQFDTAPANGVVILIQRRTPVDEALAQFTDGEVLTESELNIASRQALFAAEESKDASAFLEATAVEAIETATAADEKADQAIETANAADGKADSAVDTADDALFKAAQALSIIEAAAGIENLNSDIVNNASGVAGATVTDALDTLAGEVSGKADAAHGHAIEDVTGLQEALDAKAATSSLAAVATSGSYNDLSDKPGPSIEIGTLAFFPFQTPPPGWLERNGAAIEVALYPELAAAIYCGDANNATAEWGYRATTNVNPSANRSTTGAYIVLMDDRGIFERGWDHGAGIDTGRAFGSYQADEIKSHNHTYGATANQGLDPGHPAITATGSSFSTSSTGGAETRPKNRAYLPCIYAGV